MFRTPQHLVRAALPVLALCLPPIAASARAQGITDSPRYLRFADDDFATDRQNAPKLALSIGGHDARAVMDTGSTGVVVSLYDLFPDWKSQPDIVAAIKAALPPGSTSSAAGAIDTTKLDFGALKSISYSSSGRIMYGISVDRAITVSGAASSTGTVRSVTSAPVPVLAVIDEECTPKARHCTPNHQPTGIAMVGIGFGRASPDGETGTRRFNPFLHLQTPSAVNGYIVTALGVKIGLDATDVAQNSTTLTVLQPNTKLPGEWLPQQASISLNNKAAVIGNMLLDTGINTMLMTVPSATSSDVRVPAPPAGPNAKPSTDSTLVAGTSVGITLANAAGRTVAYSFRSGSTGGMAPASVTLVGNNGSKPDWKASFVNTGVRFLNGYTYVFDDSHGLVGFSPRSAAAP
ncbi:hypothetical protein NFI95_14110 [Acetobacteraceae bacterium KSS8]|uniref:Peptidase A1 domain-containing protein n=1 Tax=Endosaccharibacter trunci TaxID=2812733 RepID=A0ABT1W9K7_9PROT|nr:hypothetical protein [Acetobacteraceae bacterium KSS8]